MGCGIDRLARLAVRQPLRGQTMLMTSKTKASQTALRQLAGTLAQTISNLVAHFAQVWRHRRDLDQLARFDDHMLADIGLTRSDLRDAMAEPRWRDPSALLKQRLAERRSSQSLILRLAHEMLGGRPAAPPNADRRAAIAVLTW